MSKSPAYWAGAWGRWQGYASEAGGQGRRFETDSLLPAYDPRYKAFQERGQKTMIVGAKEITGHVLRTMKLRGVYSQGLIMRLDELGFRYTPPVGTDITTEANVLKYARSPADGRHAGRPVRRTLLQVGRAPSADAHRSAAHEKTESVSRIREYTMAFVGMARLANSNEKRVGKTLPRPHCSL